MKPTVALLGGSFNPVHKAHIALAQAALALPGVKQVQLLPAGQPWQKELSTAAHDRLAMLQLAIEGLDNMIINDCEIHRDGYTYTIDTLRSLPNDHSYIWILGTDQLHNFCTWRDWQAIVQLITLAVAVRPGSEYRVPNALQTFLQQQQKQLIDLTFSPVDISSTAIRDKIAAKQDVSDYLDAKVYDYIKQHNLYKHNG